MESTSPTKRRVLGSLDSNASPRPTRLDAKQAVNAPGSPLKRVTVFSCSPSQPEANKRPLLFGEVAHSDLLHPPAKKVCHEESRREMAAHESSRDGASGRDQLNAVPERRQSASPEPSSIFDSSAIDTSQATTISEPDVVAVTAAAAAAVSTLGPIPRQQTRPRLTREEAREKAEILKLRLGLASYKLRTGQTDIPLDQLELQSAAKHHRAASTFRSRNGAWASSKLQSQLQVQRAQLAAAAVATASANNSQASTASTRRPLPAAPVRRSSPDETSLSADASFSSQIQWSQGSGDSQGLPEVSERESGAVDGRREQQSSSWNQSQIQTPRRQFRGEVEEERLTSSALRGGAASGLLSLAQARS